MSILPKYAFEALITLLGVGALVSTYYLAFPSSQTSCLRSPQGFVNGVGDVVVIDGRPYSCNFLRDAIECREMEPCE